MKKDCTNCTWAKWQTTSNGKRKLESPAQCEVPLPELPHCFIDWRGSMPTRRHVDKWTKTDCPMWAKKL